MQRNRPSNGDHHPRPTSFMNDSLIAKSSPCSGVRILGLRREAWSRLSHTPAAMPSLMAEHRKALTRVG